MGHMWEEQQIWATFAVSVRTVDFYWFWHNVRAFIQSTFSESHLNLCFDFLPFRLFILLLPAPSSQPVPEDSCPVIHPSRLWRVPGGSLSSFFFFHRENSETAEHSLLKAVFVIPSHSIFHDGSVPYSPFPPTVGWQLQKQRANFTHRDDEHQQFYVFCSVNTSGQFVPEKTHFVKVSFKKQND